SRFRRLQGRKAQKRLKAAPAKDRVRRYSESVLREILFLAGGQAELRAGIESVRLQAEREGASYEFVCARSRGPHVECDDGRRFLCQALDVAGLQLVPMRVRGDLAEILGPQTRGCVDLAILKR